MFLSPEYTTYTCNGFSIWVHLFCKHIFLHVKFIHSPDPILPTKDQYNARLLLKVSE